MYSPASGRALSRKAFLWWSTILFAILLLPVWLFQYIPLVDYPNHLARQYLLTNLKDNQVLRQYYEVRWRPVPNLAQDMFTWCLHGTFSPETSGRLFLSLIILLLFAGVLWLHYTLHRHLSL